MQPDPLLNCGQPLNPHSWNQYAYTENNPLRYTDPTGLYKFGNCSGTDDQCQADRQRYRDSIAKANEALKGLDPNSKEAKALQKTLNKLGAEGTGNIKINFGDAGSTNGLSNLGRTVGNNITINYDAVDSVKSGLSLNQSESEALDAGVTTHEGAHAGGGPSILGFVGMHGEHAAYFNESVTYQGLHNNDRPFLLWNESCLPWISTNFQLTGLVSRLFSTTYIQTQFQPRLFLHQEGRNENIVLFLCLLLAFYAAMGRGHADQREVLPSRRLFVVGRTSEQYAGKMVAVHASGNGKGFLDRGLPKQILLCLDAGNCCLPKSDKTRAGV
jgi:hypothetical protein